MKASIRWLRAHAKQFNIDPDRVGILGNSAGGYLSSFEYKDGGVLAHPEDAAKASPVEYASEKSVPMLFMHGDADKLVSPSQTDLLFQALKSKGVETERYIVKNAAHGGPYWVQEPVMKIMIDFFDKYLKK